MLLRPLHQRADDVLLGRDPAEEVVLGRLVRLVVEDRRMAGVRHEIGDVLPLRHLAGVGRRGVEHDQRRAGPHLADDAVRDLADQPVGHRHHDDVGLAERLS